MQLSQAGRDALIRRECPGPDFQPVLTSYQDGSGVWTIGCGHTGPDVAPGQVITKQQALDLLAKDLESVEYCVNENVHVPLSQDQYDALVSFTFNVGTGAFARSTLLKRLNAGDYEGVPQELVRWEYARGKQSAGLVNRRASEIGQWAKGSHVASASVSVSPPPSWGQTMHGRLKAIGAAVAASGVTGEQLQGAGQQLQSLGGQWHLLATVGLVLILAGIGYELIGKRE